MSRLFIYDGRTFPDPDSRLTVDEVRRQLSDFFPELANADTREERRGEDTAYTFARRIGTKGGGRRRRRPPDIVGILRRVAPTSYGSSSSPPHSSLRTALSMLMPRVAMSRI